MPAGWTVADIPPQAGRTAVVTGANSGLGLVTARELARAGARVIMACRTVARGEQAAQTIRAAVPHAALEVRQLDLASLTSVREAARAVCADHDHLDLLVNNAGVMMPPRSLTEDGFERQFATNHLGHFALSGLLLERLEAAGSARVVTLSSIEHKPGHIAFEDLTGEGWYAPRKAYQQSKVANALFGLELDRRLRAAASSVSSMLAHPGYSNTNLQSTGPTGVMKALMAVSNRLVAQSAEQGALPTLYAATDPSARGGSFIGPDGPREMRGHPTEVRPSTEASDPQIAARLWDVSEELTGVRYLTVPAVR